MSDPFIGEIRLVPYNFAPKGWAFCHGQILPISQNTALFSIIGTMYGGDGKTTFALPNLRDRVPIHHGQGPGLSNRTVGESGGVEYVTLLSSQIPAHTHQLNYGTSSNKNENPANAILSTSGLRRSGNAYAESGNYTNLSINTLQSTGGNQPHNNCQPYLALNYIIALQGEFPVRG